MEPDRFDDVELQVLEEPVPRGPRRATRWGLSIVAVALTAGAMAAGASALTSSSAEPAKPAAKQKVYQLSNDAARSADKPCFRGEHTRTGSVRY